MGNARKSSKEEKIDGEKSAAGKIRINLYKNNIKTSFIQLEKANTYIPPQLVDSNSHHNKKNVKAIKRIVDLLFHIQLNMPYLC